MIHSTESSPAHQATIGPKPRPSIASAGIATPPAPRLKRSGTPFAPPPQLNAPRAAAQGTPVARFVHPLPQATLPRKLTIWDRIGGGPLTCAIIVHAIVLVLGAIWIFQIIRSPEPPTDMMTLGGSSGPRGTGYQVKTAKLAQTTPISKVKHIFAEGAPAKFIIPDQVADLGKVSSLAGGLGGTSQGGGAGNGVGDGHGLGNMGMRCSKQDRMKRLNDNGGTPACEEAVLKGLRWLKANQQPDGSWIGRDRIAMTGLALLAYFGHCETPASPEFGESCLRGITYLVDIGMQTDGRLVDNLGIKPGVVSRNGRDPLDEARIARAALDALAALGSRDSKEVQAAQAREAQAAAIQAREEQARKAQLRSNMMHLLVNPYAHAIATYALAEASIFCQEIKHDVPSLLEVTGQAGQYIIDNQNSSGGWDYNYNLSGPRGGDVSILGWQLQALKACSHSSIKFKGMDDCVNKAFSYLSGRHSYNGGYGYNDASGVTDGLTAIGMLSYQMWGRGQSEEVRKAADYVRQIMRFDYQNNSNLYVHYYLSQAMMQHGGHAWAAYNVLFRDQLLNNQDKDGSWNTPRDKWASDPVFSTCFCTLILEVYYRFLSTDSRSDKHPAK